MRHPSYLPLVLAMIAAAPSFSQKRWADAHEYDLCSGVGRESDPARQIAILLEEEAALAPPLPKPSATQVQTTKDAATRLLAGAAEMGRAATATANTAREGAPPLPAEADTERVLALLREWLAGKHIRTATDIEDEIRQIAESALAWANRSP